MISGAHPSTDPILSICWEVAQKFNVDFEIDGTKGTINFLTDDPSLEMEIAFELDARLGI